MAPTFLTPFFAKRDTCYDAYGPYYCNGGWYNWGRWILLGIVVVVAVLFMFSCAFMARRRRRRGALPMYGTGWMAPANGKYGSAQQQPHHMNNYQPGYQYNQQQPVYAANAPPAYGQQPQNTGTTFNPNDGYYGHQNGVQPPPNTYQRDGVAPEYAPPTGPPPGK